MTLSNVTVGADIEVFLQHRKTKKIISAEGIIKGTKEIPFVFDNENPFFCISLDNVLAEFCIPPARTAAEFAANIKRSMNYISSTIPEELCIAVLPSANLDRKFLATLNAQTFGCEPDFNAYTGFINNGFSLSKPDPTLRSAGGHIHIGYSEATEYDKLSYFADTNRCDIIKVMDLFLGIPSIIMEPDNQRRILYGKAGAFRPKPYGIEYRTISNFYLANDRLIDWVYGNVELAVDFINKGNIIDEGLGDSIQATINNNDKDSANSLIDHFKIKLAA